MIYIETPYSIPYDIFALENWLATEKRFDEDCFLLWNTTPSMIIGKYQNPFEEVNMNYVKEHNILIARRLSGGGTMYIDKGGLEFTFISKDREKEISFEEFVRPVVEALKRLGVEDVSFTGRNDILVCGKKISGNSQYKTGGYTVHHGTLLYNTNLEEVVRSTTVDPHKIISKSIKSVKERVTNISEHMENPTDIETFKRNLISEIVGEGNIYTLTEEDKAAIKKLSDEKFSTEEFIYGKTPDFEFKKTGYFKGGKLTVSLEVKKGVITDAYISGDFFGTVEQEDIRNALCGVKFKAEDVTSALKKIEDKFYNIDADSIGSIIFVDESNNL